MTSASEPVQERFSLGLFFVTVAVTLTALAAALRFLAPEWWGLQLSSPWWALVAVFLGVSLFNCFFEFFFHRYVLHRHVIPGLGRLCRQHTLHHALTRVSRRPSRDGRGLLFVENKFPIVEPEQGEGSFFPWYSLAAFAAMLTPGFLLLQHVLPAFPWFFGGIAALVSSLLLYELLHAINHWPFERWAPLVENARWGWFWRPVYSFHLRHHAVIDCNESVSGFFGLPVADWTFRTCVIPPTIYADGEAWKPENFTAPRPRGVIRWLDRVSARLIAARRKRAVAPKAAGERVYSRGEQFANWFTHSAGAALSVLGLGLLLVLASLRGDAWYIASFAVFGLSLLVLYVCSTLYHLARTERHRGWLGRLAHAAIYLLMAGTYTPFLLTHLRSFWGWTVLGIIWALCGTGAILRLVGVELSRTVLVVISLFAGWLIVVAAQPMLVAVPAPAWWFLLAGALCYTAGVPFYRWKRLRYHHTFWHTFVLGGSACHFLAVLLLLEIPRS